ncbi:hypothetical protein [Aurantimonas sp. HBX-1]|uniref:hypothetical protein n=1 Tax=Aurantimonas sp. HBX-1 TaxID=2906072 RepID=UPI001F19553D|nr:hypothetical protein [Aurantimonas sp. HBX-1]UIJ71029.1 hypothetical protein LXB15_15040 [Aurantimonas sp. HBX-1]
MTRILYWNIEKFAANKMANPSTKRQRGASMTAAQASAARLAYINTHWGITAGGVLSRPDIIVIVEVATGYDGPGILARGSGPDGALALLVALRAVTGNANWMLVPPLQTGPREAVAVYFDSSNLVFTGPWLWPGGVGPAIAPLAPGVFGPALPTVAYAAPFAGALPVAAVPAGTINTGTAQDQLAACTDFTYAAAHMNAGTAVNFGALRTPYWVSFAEMSGGGALPVVRNISLFCIHSPASAAAGQYLTDLADLAEITDGIAANEVRVVLGDFNVNLLNNNATKTRNASYTAMAANYALGIDRPGGPPAPIDGWLGYFATHIKRGNGSTYWTTGTQTDYYPGYGYIGSTIYQNFYSIDNILARYGAGVAAGGPMTDVTVLNGVVGSRYNVIAAPVPGNPPIGTYDLPIYMAGAPFAAPAAQAPAFSAGRRSAFNGWNNYGRIRSTSDHLAIVADI